MAEAVGRDLAEAKALLARADAAEVGVREAGPRVVHQDADRARARAAHWFSAGGRGPLPQPRVPARRAPNPCPPEPKKNASDPGDALPVAPRFEETAPSQLPKDVASPTDQARRGLRRALHRKDDVGRSGLRLRSRAYNSPWVARALISLEGVGARRNGGATVDFGIDSFDLRVTDVARSTDWSWSALDKDIVPEESRLIVKKNRITLKLKKVKPNTRTTRTDLKKKGGKAAKDKCTRGKIRGERIMDMMKDLYDNGDDNMRKIIGQYDEVAQRREAGPL